jgi:hypothetical protein
MYRKFFLVVYDEGDEEERKLEYYKIIKEKYLVLCSQRALTMKQMNDDMRNDEN